MRITRSRLMIAGLLVLAALSIATTASAEEYDLVINNGNNTVNFCNCSPA